MTPHRDESPRTKVDELLSEIRTHVDSRIDQQAREIERLRELIAQNQISDEEATKRIEQLESGFEEMREEVKEVTKEVAKMNLIVASFSPRLDRFFDNLWKVVFFLLAIIGALVGIRIL